MRFCPFCAKETSDDAGRCVHCGRRLSARTAQNAVVSQQPPGAPLHPTMLGLGPGKGRPAQVDRLDKDAPVGPTAIGSPAGFAADFSEPPSSESPTGGDTVVREPQPTKVIGPGKLAGQIAQKPRPDNPLDEETRLPPHAPGMVHPGGAGKHSQAVLPAFDGAQRGGAPFKDTAQRDGVPSIDPPTSPGTSPRRRPAGNRTPFQRGRNSPVGGTRTPAPVGAAGLQVSGPTIVNDAPGGPQGQKHSGPAIASSRESPDATSQMAVGDMMALGVPLGGPSDQSPKTSQNNIPALPPPPRGPTQQPSAVTGPMPLPPMPSGASSLLISGSYSPPLRVPAVPPAAP